MSPECAGTIDFGSANAKYKLLFECIYDAVFLIDTGGKILDTNQAAIKMYGYTREQLLSMNLRDLRAPRERPALEKTMKEALNKGMVYETAGMRKDGSAVPIEVSLRGISLNGEKLLLAIVRDISKRREAERSLARLAAIVESSHDAIIGMRLNGIITDWNHGAELIYGYTPKEAIGRHISMCIPTNRKGELAEILKKVTDGRSIEGLETQRVRKNGELFTMLLTASPIRCPDSTIIGISWVGRDITERVKAEEALRQQAALIDLSPDAIVIRTFDGVITFWSRGAESMYGYSKGEAMGGIMQDLLKTRFPGPWEKINDQLLHAGYWSGELLHTARDGRQVVVQSRWLGQYDRLGNVAEVLESDVDITERKCAEEEVGREKERAEFFLDLVGHDIKNMNQVAIGYLEIAAEQCRSCPENKEYIDKSLDTLWNSSKLIENVRLLHQAEAHELPLSPVDVSEILSKVRAGSLHVPGRSVSINLTSYCECIVNANELLQDVFSNLLGNAIKHSTGPVTIDINVSESFEDRQRYCKITVEDNGPGIPDEAKGRLFTRFQPGMTGAHGKGLGLYLVGILVNGFHGKIWVEDRVPGDTAKGARFVVMLPGA